MIAGLSLHSSSKKNRIFCCLIPNNLSALCFCSETYSQTNVSAEFKFPATRQMKSGYREKIISNVEHVKEICRAKKMATKK